MLLHRLKTIISYLRGFLFCIWAAVFCKKFRANGVPRCYGWPDIRSAQGEMQLGQGVHLGKIKLILAKGGRLILEDGVSINDGTVIGVLSKVKIGKRSAIAENVMIRDHDHDFSRVPIGSAPEDYIISEVSIGKGCWLGYGSIILKGVIVSDGAVIGAGAVITKNIDVGNIVVANPQRVIGRRKEV